MKDILKSLGVKSQLAIGIIGAIAMIGTVPIADGKALPQILHSHFVNPTKFDVALNNKVDLKEIVQAYEYSLRKHIEKLNDIKSRTRDNPSDMSIELERWKAEKEQLENKLRQWQDRVNENRVIVDAFITGTA